MNLLLGYKIVVSKFMVGAKLAIGTDDCCLVVSPAMLDLISNCETEDELRHLLANIPVRHLPIKMLLEMPVLGMTTEPPRSRRDETWGG
jgi:hypothetical protein